MSDSGLWMLAGSGATLALLLLLVGLRRLFSGRPAADMHHRIRALEADARVARRTAEEAAGQLAEHAEALAAVTDERDGLDAQLGVLRDRCQDLESRLRQECSKTTMLRQELADRSEEMTRTHFELKEAKTELEVFNAGSDVVHAEAARLRVERDELESELQRLRTRLAGVEQGGTDPAVGGSG